MGLLNRSAVVVRPREPYLQWTKQDDATGAAEKMFEKMCAEPMVYLIAESQTGDDLPELLRNAWQQVFEAMLEAWLTDPEMWPQNRTWEMFQEWFEVQSCESVHDLLEEEPLEDI